MENWITVDGELVIQRVYKLSEMIKPENKVETLQKMLNDAIFEERYEDAAKYRDEIAALK